LNGAGQELAPPGPFCRFLIPTRVLLSPAFFLTNQKLIACFDGLVKHWSNH